MAEVRFAEELRGPTWLRILGVLVIVAGILLAADAALVEPARFAGGGLFAATVGVVVLIGVGVLLIRVRSSIEVADDVVTIALHPVWRRSFHRVDLAGARRVDLTVREFGGLGYRVLPGNRRALLLSAGPGVEFRVRAAAGSPVSGTPSTGTPSSGLLYSVRTDRPADLLAALLRR